MCKEMTKTYNTDIVNAISIIDDENNNQTIFENNFYNIPLYQRAFAWDKDNIDKLIEDINGNEENNYYLGSLVVDIKDQNIFEVIDGQQRLTALFLILAVLKYDYAEELKKEIDLSHKNLRYDCREKSNYTLQNIDKIVNYIDINKKGKAVSNQDKQDIKLDKEVEESMELGIKYIKMYFANKQNKVDIKEFFDKLKKVKLFRIAVPTHTDLNRYFETMNTRGEQLEQTDIIKAKLMSNFADNSALQNCFATVWDACRNMEGYVQMHFTKKIRNFIFGVEKDNIWNTFSFTQDEFLESLVKNTEEQQKEKQNENKAPKNTEKQAPNNEGYSIIEVIDVIDSNNEKKTSNKKKTLNDLTQSLWFDELEERDKEKTFDSIINFEYFLLHTLKVLAIKENIIDKSADFPFDEKKLVDTFEEIQEKYVKKTIDANRIEEFAKAKLKFSNTFIWYLLKCRFLFDKYIIKREKSFNDNKNKTDDDGNWSLKRLKSTDGQKAYTVGTFNNKDDDKDDNDKNAILMMQACMRVSYTSPKTMHWITHLMKWLFEETASNAGIIDPLKYEIKIVNYIKEEVSKVFFDEHTDDFAKLGVKTPHIALNYLDYLLWQECRNGNAYKYLLNLNKTVTDDKIANDLNYKEFDFSYRNSVEHWYPRHPIRENDYDSLLWTDENGYGNVDRFGNLCLLQSNINSRFSNLVPTSKKTNYPDTINNGSLKLRIMSVLTTKDDEWRGDKEQDTPSVCAQHEKQMIKLLCDACYTKSAFDKYCERQGFQQKIVDNDNN